MYRSGLIVTTLSRSMVETLSCFIHSSSVFTVEFKCVSGSFGDLLQAQQGKYLSNFPIMAKEKLASVVKKGKPKLTLVFMLLS